MMQFLLKLSFFLSLVPFLVSEKVYNKYHIRLNPQVQDSLYSGSISQGILENRRIDEASGLAASRIHGKVLYTHNDSGGDPIVYRIDTTGKMLGNITLDGVVNRDWEDIAVGPGTETGKNYVYVGEIGDNNGKHPFVDIFRFEEPVSLEDTVVHPEIIRLKYPDGPKDAEALMVDPQDGDVYLLSKRDSSNVLYRASSQQINQKEAVLEKVMELPITMSVAGDISADGRKILIKNYWVVYYWERAEGESIADVLSRDPIILPYTPEPQGEAVAFDKDGKSYFTLSEKKFGVTPVLYRYFEK